METVTMTLQRFLETQRQIKVLEEINAKTLEANRQLNIVIKELKEMILPLMVSNWKIKEYTLEELTDPNSWKFGLENAKELLIYFELEELVEFIKKEKEKIEKEKEEENE